MARKHNVVFKVTTEEKSMIARVAKQMERSQSDTLRTLVRQADRQINSGNAVSSNGATNNGQAKSGC